MKTYLGFMAVALTVIGMQSCSAPRAEVSLQVQTAAGMLEGVCDSVEASPVKMFLGVPFAQAPVGDLRWKAPQPVQPWEGVRPAKEFGNDPMQPNVFGDMNFRGPSRSEDCLYLNIWTPAQYADEALPVLIYFNGGGLMAGSGSEPRYDGCALVRKGVIGVTANYREGIFGFVAHPELTAEAEYKGSGNYGFLDQVAAIQWVKDNIAAFGGDPQRINIVGESAGSFSVSLLMTSPLSKNLIAGALLSSGAEVLPYEAVAQETAEANGKALLESKGLNSIAQARALPADSLQALLPPTGMANVVLDGYFAQESADEVFLKGEQAQVPLLAGWNSMEASPLRFFGNQTPSLELLTSVLSGTFGEATAEILSAYEITTDADVLSQKAVDLCSDMFTGFPTWKCCDYHAAKQPVYRYWYSHPRPEVSEKMKGMVAALAGGVRKQTEEEKKAEEARPKVPAGAVHSADIEYAMGTLDTNDFYNWNEDDYRISEMFLTLYANFCKTGNPNGEGLPVWHTITAGAATNPVLHIDTETREVTQNDAGRKALEKFYLSRQAK